VSDDDRWRRAYRREDTKEQVKRNIDAEFQAHLDMRVEELRARGLSEEEARARAREMLGDVARAAGDCERTDRKWLLRDRIGHVLGSVIKDLSLALRMFRTNPLFAFMASLCLAVGITFTAATYTFLDATILNPLPFEDADEIVMVGKVSYAEDWHVLMSPYADFRDWEAENHVFADLAAYSWEIFSITDLDSPVRLRGSEITESFDDVLRVSAFLGRTFTPADFAPDAERVALLGYGLWQRAYGGDPEVVGRLITLDGQHRHRVVGIMPPNFTFPDFRELWVPCLPRDTQDRTWNRYIVFGRLRGGVSLETAHAEMTTIGARIAAAYPESDNPGEVRVVPYGRYLTQSLSTPLVIIFLVSCLVLVLACSNLASLMLSRATSRTRELAVRAVLGAGRGRLIQQLMVESLVIAAVGGVVGILMGRVSLDLLLAKFPRDVPGFLQFEMNGQVLAVLGGIIVLSGILFGLAPALSVRRGALGASLRLDTVRMSAGRNLARVRSSLVVFQIALATLILSLTGVVVRSYIQSQHHHIGVDSDRLLGQRLSLPYWAYSTPESFVAFFRDGMERLSALPEVEAAEYVSHAPAARTDWRSTVTTNEIAADPDRPFREVRARVVSPGYFAAAGIPLLSGRDFAESDQDDGPQRVVANASLARLLWPGEDPVGRTLYRSHEIDPESARQVIGVVGDVRHGGPAVPAGPCVYFLMDLRAVHSAGWLIIRTARDPASLSSLMRQTLQGLDPQLALPAPQTVVDLAREKTWRTIFSTWILTVVASFALVLALVGILGVVAYSVANRMHEFGIRMALGADTGSILRAVLLKGALMAGVGISAGMVAAFGAARFVGSVLVNTSGRDPLVFAVVFVLLASMTLLASYLPARRVTHIDPVEVLKEE
jgi:predicted permease